MEENSKNRRQKKFIDREIQGRLALMVVKNALVYLLLLAIFIFVPLAIRLNAEESTPELHDAANAFLALHEHFWPAIFFVLIVIGIHSIRVSHRMVGPVYRFKETLKGIGKNDLSYTVTLRDGDFFVDLMDEINKMTLSLRSGLQELKDKEGALRRAVSDLNAMLDKGNCDTEHLKACTQLIGQNEEALRMSIDKFQLDKK